VHPGSRHPSDKRYTSDGCHSTPPFERSVPDGGELFLSRRRRILTTEAIPNRGHLERSVAPYCDVRSTMRRFPQPRRCLDLGSRRIPHPRHQAVTGPGNRLAPSSILMHRPMSGSIRSKRSSGSLRVIRYSCHRRAVSSSPCEVRTHSTSKARLEDESSNQRPQLSASPRDWRGTSRECATRSRSLTTVYDLARSKRARRVSGLLIGDPSRAQTVEASRSRPVLASRGIEARGPRFGRLLRASCRDPRRGCYASQRASPPRLR